MAYRGSIYNFMAYRDIRQSQIDFVRFFRSTSQNDDHILRIFNTNDGYYAVFGKQNAEHIANNILNINPEFIKQYPPKIKEKDDNNNSISVIYFKSNHRSKIIQHYVFELNKSIEMYTRNNKSKNWSICDKISPPNYSTDYTPTQLKMTPSKYWQFKQSHFDGILCFKVGKCYELYYIDAVIAHNICDLSYMSGDIPYVGFPDKLFINYAESFIKYGYKVYRVELEQTDDRADFILNIALNLFPNAQNMNSNGIILSPMGDRELSIWFKRPLTDIKQIHRRQKLIKLFVENDEQRSNLRDEYVKKLIDLEKISSKLINNKADLKDMVCLYDFVNVIPFIKDELKLMNDVEFMNDGCKPLNVLNNEFIVVIKEIESDFNNYMAMIEQMVELEKVPKEYLIKNIYDKPLVLYGKKKENIMCDIEKEMHDAIVDLDFKDNVVSMYVTEDRKYYLGIKDKIINDKIANNCHYIVIGSRNKCFYFTTKKLTKLSTELIEIEQMYLKRQKPIVDKMIEIGKTYIPVIDKAAKIFCELDVILALAHAVATSINFNIAYLKTLDEKVQCTVFGYVRFNLKAQTIYSLIPYYILAYYRRH
eukprot:65199_1